MSMTVEQAKRILGSTDKIPQSYEGIYTMLLHYAASGDGPLSVLKNSECKQITDLLNRQQERIVQMEGALEKIAAERPLTGPLNLSDLDMQRIAREALSGASEGKGDALKLACSKLAKYSGSCPYDMEDYFMEKCNDCQNEYAACWMEYFKSGGGVENEQNTST